MIDVTERIQLWVTPMVRDTEIRLLSGGKEAIEQHRQIEPSFAASEVVDRLHAAIDAGRGADGGGSPQSGSPQPRSS